MEFYHRTADGLSVIWYMPMLLKFLTYNLILRKGAEKNETSPLIQSFHCEKILGYFHALPKGNSPFSC